MKVKKRISLAQTNQIHGGKVYLLSATPSPRVIKGDAFIAQESDACCFIRTADCVPILIADTKGSGVGAVHAGWRGTAANIVGNTIREMREHFGTDPSSCVAAIGPSICGDCYEVGEEVISFLRLLPISDSWNLGKSRVDLKEANRGLLKRAGLSEAMIDMTPHCTRCDVRFASWRRDQEKEERQFSFIMRKGDASPSLKETM